MTGLIKICGVRTPAILDAVIEHGADMAGFVHFPPSPRHLPLDAIAPLLEAAWHGSVETAILLVDPDDALVAAAAALGPDYLQLHGAEPPERVRAVAALAGCRIIKALPVGEAADLETVATYAGVADRLLLDAKPPRGATRPGGLGRRFDWTLLKALDPSLPFMLSGGLDADVVAEAVETVRPMGLDVSSGVERESGFKDSVMIAEFIAAARQAYERIGM